MTSCERYEIVLSSLLDGEAPPESAAEALEHALTCTECSRFFRAARRLDATARRLDVATAELPDGRAAELWAAIGRRVGRGGSDSGRFGPVWGRALRTAALLVLGLGGGYLLAVLGSADARVADGGPGVVAAALRPAGEMSERRFVALADELLSADVRYQRAMLEVLRLVPALETGEGFGRNEENGPIVRASIRDDARASGSL